jgi:hypothetical protein
MEDAAAKNDANNASYRRVFITPQPGQAAMVELNNQNKTQRTQTAIDAWKTNDTEVIVKAIDVDGDRIGRIQFGIRSKPLPGGGFHHEIAVHNLSSARAARGIALKTSGGALRNSGFHAVRYDQEPYSQTDWKFDPQPALATWTADTFKVNENANALRWGTTYSFWCDSDQAAVSLTIHLFKPLPGQPDSVDVPL